MIAETDLEDVEDILYQLCTWSISVRNVVLRQYMLMLHQKTRSTLYYIYLITVYITWSISKILNAQYSCIAIE